MENSVPSSSSGAHGTNPGVRMLSVKAETEYDYDLFTIGAGSGGVRASRMSTQYGVKVAVCAISTCPSPINRIPRVRHDGHLPVDGSTSPSPAPSETIEQLSSREAPQ
jgi:hypothetical protein